MNEHSEEFEDEEVIYEAEVPILTVSAGENEKGSVFRDFLNMRNEASFCDVAFVVQGTLFRAHRVVVRFVNQRMQLTTTSMHILVSRVGDHGQ
mmetsp:Transcript_15475/g.25778  ORF Transcript_15475/g.25778 Transcript_15475/m.25778 type:complete len:93 (+) Transcript_15475:79-357(+)